MITDTQSINQLIIITMEKPVAQNITIMRAVIREDLSASMAQNLAEELKKAVEWLGMLDCLFLIGLHLLDLSSSWRMLVVTFIGWGSVCKSELMQL